MDRTELTKTGVAEGPNEALISLSLKDKATPLPKLNALELSQTVPTALPQAIARAGVAWKLPPAVVPFLARSLQSRWQSYREELRQCQERFSEQSVHRFRVATRRLIAQLVMIESVAHEASLRKARRLLKRRLKELGELRDTHVQLLFIERQLSRYPELRAVRAFLRHRERRLEKRAAAQLSEFKTRKLGKWISRVGEQLMPNHQTRDESAVHRNGKDTRELEQVADALTRATTHAFGEVVCRRQSIDPQTASTVHRTRIAFKKFRYMMETLSTDFTGLDKKDLRELALYQRRMGLLQDLEVVQQSVARFSRKNPDLAKQLQPFCRYLRARRADTLRSFLKSADDLFTFWPPMRNATNGDVTGAAVTNGVH